jgi:predicted DNA-binding transcriptional regulator YafY
LGVGQELKAAMLKLTAALPAARREDEEKVRQRFYLDSTPWEVGETAVPHLQTVHHAVWQSQKLQITFRLPYHNIELQHLVEPYGLVAKASTWYLVYWRDGFRVQRVAELLTAQTLDETFERQSDFDLAVFWQDWCAQQEANRTLYPVTVRVAAHFIAELPRYFGEEVGQQIPPANSVTDQITVTLNFASLEAARTRLLGFGNAIEVLEPRALRASIQDYATQILMLYTA